MKDLLHYIGNEPFYIRAEKLLERKFTGGNVPEVFQLCPNVKGFSRLGVTKMYSATIIMMVVSLSMEKYNRQQWQRLTNLLFGQSQQAVFTTEAVHAYFISPVVSNILVSFHLVTTNAMNATGISSRLSSNDTWSAFLYLNQKV